MKMMRLTPELSRQHYAEHVNKPFYPALESFVTGGPLVAMVVEGLESIRVVREMLGATSGLKAAAGTIRGDYSSSRQMNLVHASDGHESAAREIGRSAHQAAQGTEEVTGGIEAMTRAADSTGSASGEVAAAAGKLAENSGTLKTLVDGFLADVKAA